MDSPLKVLITSRKNLQSKYGTKFPAVEKLFAGLVKADLLRNIVTRVIYIDFADSLTGTGWTAVSAVTAQNAKKAVDKIYQSLNPAYIVLFGAQDVFPFQEIKNPASDDDDTVPSDLPYSCDSPYSNNISSFTGPGRVVGRIPDIPGAADMAYLKKVFDAVIGYKQVAPEKLTSYFAITASVWKKSTQLSCSNMFGNNTKLKVCPPDLSPFTKTALKPLVHFYNCHGSPSDSKYYGQKGDEYPTAQWSPDLDGKISKGTIVAAECCYGAQLFTPEEEDTGNLSIATTYFKNKVIAMTGSSTIAYGPSSGNGLADLLTQYFIKNVINGASTGRALLEARQKFLTVSGPQLDPYELKTLAQFYLLGDPSVQVVIEPAREFAADTVQNRRLNLANKGINLAKTIAPSNRVTDPVKRGKEGLTAGMKEIFQQVGFTGDEDEFLYEIKSGRRSVYTMAKGISGSETVSYRTFVQKPVSFTGKVHVSQVLVLKEAGDQVLGWRVYHRK